MKVFKIMTYYFTNLMIYEITIQMLIELDLMIIYRSRVVITKSSLYVDLEGLIRFIL